ncbi:MAG: type I-E CRISPR-associated protein Cse1/CasA, partial [Candidatus Hadarchaeum sp.]
LNLPILGKLEDEEDGYADRPIWRQDRPELLRDRAQGKNRKIEPLRGIRDRLTFQSRLIRLLPENKDGEVVVRRAAFNHGRSLSDEQHQFDPMQAYQASKEGGYGVVRLSPERASWRDIHALLGGVVPDTEGKMEPKKPAAFSTLGNALAQGLPGLDASRRLRLNVAGLATDQAKVLLWRHDRLDTPASVLCDEIMVERVGQLLRDAEKVARDLRKATFRLCEIFLAPLSRDVNGQRVEGTAGVDTRRVSDLLKCIDPHPAYWARLESAFHQLLLRLADDPENASEQWRDRVEAEAKCAFDEAAGRLGESPQMLRARALVRVSFKVPSRRRARKSSVRNADRKGETQQNGSG